MLNPLEWTCWRDPAHTSTTTHPEFGWPMCTECKASPAYHERYAFMDPAYTITLFVPMSPSPTYALCDPASGIVGWNTLPGHTQIYFEGFRFGAPEGLDPRGRWQKACQIACDRAITAYPTIAQAIVKNDAVIPVGTYQPASRTFDVIDDLHLDEWLGIAVGGLL